MTSGENITSEVLALLHQAHDAYYRRDIEGFLVCFTPDAVMFGTGIDEKRVGQSEIKMQAERDWAQSEALAFNWHWHTVSSLSDHAWLAAEGVMTGMADGQPLRFPVRFSGVLKRIGSQWRFVLAHYSFPPSEQDAGKSLPVGG